MTEKHTERIARAQRRIKERFGEECDGDEWESGCTLLKVYNSEDEAEYEQVTQYNTVRCTHNRKLPN